MSAFDWYLPVVLLFTSASSYLLRDQRLWAVSIVILFGITGRYGVRSYRWMKAYVAGLDAIAAGLALFVAAVSVSLGKRRRPSPILNVDVSSTDRSERS